MKQHRRSRRASYVKRERTLRTAKSHHVEPPPLDPPHVREIAPMTELEIRAQDGDR